MKQLTIAEMNAEQLRKVFASNEGLQNDVYDDLVESEMHHVSDVIDILRPALRDWSVGPGARSYVSPASSERFIHAMREVCDSYALLDDEGTALVRKAEATIDEFHNVNVADEEEYVRLEDKIDIYADTIENLVGQAFDSMFNEVDTKYCEEHFVDFYAEARLDGDEYVEVDEDGTSDWKLKQNVVKTF